MIFVFLSSLIFFVNPFSIQMVPQGVLSVEKAIPLFDYLPSGEFPLGRFLSGVILESPSFQISFA